MDPLSLIAMASTTVKGIKTLVEHGAELETVATKLSAWYSYAADIKHLEERAENPPLFRRLTNRQSVEAEALNATIAAKRLDEQEAELRSLIMMRFGAETYKEMILLRRKIKKQREDAIYRQRRRRQRFVEWAAGIVALLFVAGIIFGMVTLIRGTP